MLIDLHTHTAPLSYDALQTPEQLVLEAKGLGLDGLCLTEHDAFWDLDDLVRLQRRHNILLLPGCEINTEEGHFLAFGLKEYVFGMHKLPFLWKQVESVGGVLIAAHPYRRRNIRNHSETDLSSKVQQAASERPFRHCHAVETINGRGSDAENAFSSKLAVALSLPRRRRQRLPRPRRPGRLRHPLQRQNSQPGRPYRRPPSRPLHPSYPFPHDGDVCITAKCVINHARITPYRKTAARATSNSNAKSSSCRPCLTAKSISNRQAYNPLNRGHENRRACSNVFLTAKSARSSSRRPISPRGTPVSTNSFATVTSRSCRAIIAWMYGSAAPSFRSFPNSLSANDEFPWTIASTAAKMLASRTCATIRRTCPSSICCPPAYSDNFSNSVSNSRRFGPTYWFSIRSAPGEMLAPFAFALFRIHRANSSPRGTGNRRTSAFPPSPATTGYSP